jgi:hypothetical protein
MTSCDPITTTARQAQRQYQGDIEGYVTNGLGGVATIRFTRQAEFIVHRDDPARNRVSD